MVHNPEQTPLISQALVDLATANKLEFIDVDQYKTKSGRRLTITELGFVDTVNLNYKLKYDELSEDYEELKSKYEVISAERKKLAINSNRIIGEKTMLKVKQIYDSVGLSDKERLLEIKRYLGL